MRRLTFLALSFLILVIAAASHERSHHAQQSAPVQTKAARALQSNTLCAQEERVIFACGLKQPAKIVSVCASKDLTRETGYLQYRFGLATKIELEFPKDRTGTQEKFKYTHYFRALVDLNEIGFSIDGVEYSVIDDYNAEETPAQSVEGLAINWPGARRKEVRYICRTKPRTDYTDLQAVLSSP